MALEAPLVADAPTEEAALDAISRRDGVSANVNGVFVNRWTVATMRTTGTTGTGRSRYQTWKRVRKSRWKWTLEMKMEGSAPCTVHVAAGKAWRAKVPLSREHGLFGARVSRVRVRGSEGRGGEALA